LVYQLMYKEIATLLLEIQTIFHNFIAQRH
jgi:hypothetical protein